MQKDVIYIDVDDDITSIIGKVKASKEAVVALVPPKRVGVLQSAVNLRLLARAAKQANKQLALITNDHSLHSLSATAGIPVAKNLQSKPELAEIAVLDVDDDEIIDGASLPIGDHVTQSKSPAEEKELRNSAMAASLASIANVGKKEGEKKAKKGSKVPDFDKFRKKLVFIIVGIILLASFMVWAIFFAPRATIVLSAKTTTSSVNEQVVISADKETDLTTGTIKATAVEESEDKSLSFSTTGKKDVGKKAGGTVQFSTDSISVARDGVTIPAGTELRSTSDLVFITNETVSITLTNSSGTSSVTAAENGSKYNAAEGAMSGAPDGVSADLTDATSGGLTKIVKVVTASDVQKAKQQLVDEKNDTVKDDLVAKFGKGSVVLDESFTIDYNDVTSTPAVGDEADSATLKSTIVYTLYGADKAEVKKYIDAYFKQELEGTTDQKVYEDGADKAVFQDISKKDSGASATLIATAQIGPKINDETVKNESKGKKFGEIQQNLESIPNVDSVDVKFFPFWVSTVPEDSSKITVEFKLDEQK